MLEGRWGRQKYSGKDREDKWLRGGRPPHGRTLVHHELDTKTRTLHIHPGSILLCLAQELTKLKHVKEKSLTFQVSKLFG